MIPDLDIWRAAAILVQRHGADDAAVVAAQRGDEMRAKGDEEGRTIWKAIRTAARGAEGRRAGELMPLLKDCLSNSS